MTTPGLLVTFNAGRSTVKVGLFETRDGKPSRVARGMVDFSRRTRNRLSPEMRSPFFSAMPDWTLSGRSF
ncbi:hypothetical protein HT585_15385 [Ensifer sp. HO-A22]|uniref:Uncharacterized protein n=1 Tax=Ensifer oleiphilus TaxID=2742698 RepID=A0A7Y6Q750_9HYPH|nr:hypothetical protein [Ensifer oleiphilus]NVD40250.1 hypothetical protein [Ensifer oleiphilus]